MKLYLKKILSVLLGVLLIISIYPAPVFAGNNYEDGSIRIILNETAKQAGVTLYASRYSATSWEEKGGKTFNDTFDIGETDFYNFSQGFVFFNKVNDYEFKGWEISSPSGSKQFISTSSIQLGSYYDEDDEEDVYSEVNLLTSSMTEQTWSQIKISYAKYVDGDWTIEPIFEKTGGSSTSSYEFTLNNKDSKTAVEKGEALVLDMRISGAAYNAFSAVVTYDSSLFEYKSCTPTTVSVDTATDGTLKLSATGLSANDGDLAATLTFTAKAVNEAKIGAFTITSAAATTSDAAVSDDAPAAATGEPVSVTVNAVTTYTVTYPNGTTDTVASGDDVTFTLSEKYADYEAEGFTYTVTAGDLTVEDNNDGTYTIKNVTGDVAVVVAKIFAGTLTTETLTVGSASYKVAKISGAAPSGKTFFYDGKQMIKSGESYLYIIGTSGKADSSKITVAATESEIVMASTGDVNQTGKIDINDAQLVSDLYNGKYTDFETVSMVKFLAADVNGDRVVDTSDIAAVISNTEFVY